MDTKNTHNSSTQAAAALLKIGKQFLDEDKPREACHMVSTALRLSLEASIRVRGEPVKECGKKPMGPLIARAAHLRAISQQQVGLLRRFSKVHWNSIKGMQDDFAEAVKIVEFLQCELCMVQTDDMPADDMQLLAVATESESSESESSELEAIESNPSESESIPPEEVEPESFPTSLRDRVANREKSCTVNDAFGLLLSAAETYIQRGQHIESRDILKAAAEISLRRWWKSSRLSRPSKDMPSRKELLKRAVINRKKYDRISATIRRRESFNVANLNELQDVVLNIHQRAILLESSSR